VILGNYGIKKAHSGKLSDKTHQQCFGQNRQKEVCEIFDWQSRHPESVPREKVTGNYST
jgi:hypothetical protein